MKCRSCNSSETRVTATEKKPNETWRYCRCLKCGTRYKTLEVYVLRKRGAKPGAAIHVNHVKKGEENGSSVLLEKNIVEIRELAKENVKYKDIATKFGIHPQTVYRIVKRKMWSHVP